MNRFIAVLFAKRTPVYFRIAAVVVAAYATCPAIAFAQLETNSELARRGVEPFATCARNGPATTTLRLTTRAIGPGASATTDDPFFGPADIGRWIGPRDRAGLARVTAVADSNHATIEITKGFGQGTYKPRTWGRWPFCYMSMTGTTGGGRYGFNTGSGHQAKEVNTLNLVLDRGQQYSVDRCSLAHDSFYWGPATDKSPVPGETQCNNNHWVRFCFLKVQPKTVEEAAALNRVAPVRVPFLQATEAVNFCDPVRNWIDLPTNANWIRPAADICYGTGGQFIVGFHDRSASGAVVPKDFVLDVTGRDEGGGARVIVSAKKSECNQKWRMVPGTGNPARYGYEIRGLGGRCLGTPQHRRPKRGDLVQMWDCSGSYTQKWHYEHGQIRSQPANRQETRLCLTVQSFNVPSPVIVRGCGNHRPGQNLNQQWTFATQ